MTAVLSGGRAAEPEGKGSHEGMPPAHSSRHRVGEDTTVRRTALIRWGGGIAIGLVLVGLLMRFGQDPPASPPPQSGPDDSTSSAGVSQTDTQTLDAVDRLALASSTAYEDPLGYQHVTGRVTNISDAALQDVIAVVMWYTDWEDFVTTAEGPVDVEPLLPGQTSSFDILGPVNPYASKFSVQFTEAGGDTIQTAGGGTIQTAVE